MKFRTLSYCSILALLTLGCTTSSIVSIDDGTHVVSSSGAGFDTGGVRENVYKAARSYCNKTGQTIESVSYDSIRGQAGRNVPAAELKFKCVPQSTLSSGKNFPETSTDNASTKKDIYDELIKLNQLKEKGIINEEEFKLEKAKILNH